MIRLVLSHERGYPWKSLRWGASTLYYKGNSWEIGDALERLIRSSPASESSLLGCLRDLPWSYAAVLEQDGSLLAVVDRLRTQPLLYSVAGDDVTITDDAYSRKAGLQPSIDATIPAAEFQLAGYVLGPDTLSRSIRAIQAGECLRVTTASGASVCETVSYRPPIGAPVLDDTSPDAGVPLLMEACDAIFAELCHGIRDRQAVLPLSSGVDSRFIAAMLKRHGHQDVLTFTYGRPENWEVGTSKATAHALGYPWHFVPYSRRMWRDWYRTADMADYQPFASRHVATPHVQDWPAVMELKRRGVLRQDAVFLPGHTAILIANRLDRSILEEQESLRLEALAAALYKHHFVLQRTERVIDSNASIIERIRALLPPSVEGDNHRLLNAYFNFEATERHAKMLVNSVRVYEYWGYQWTVPLWDGRLVDLWARVPYAGRFSKRWFRDLLTRTNLYGLFPPGSPPGVCDRVRQWAKDNPLTYAPLKRLKCVEERLFGYFHHFLDWYGITSYPKYVFHMGQCGNVYSLLSRLYLNSVSAYPDEITG